MRNNKETLNEAYKEIAKLSSKLSRSDGAVKLMLSEFKLLVDELSNLKRDSAKSLESADKTPAVLSLNPIATYEISSQVERAILRLKKDLAINTAGGVSESKMNGAIRKSKISDEEIKKIIHDTITLTFVNNLYGRK